MNRSDCGSTDSSLHILINLRPAEKLLPGGMGFLPLRAGALAGEDIAEELAGIAGFDP